MQEMSNKNEMIGQLLKELASGEEVKQKLSSDPEFISSLSNGVATELLEKGYIEDRIFTKEQTMTMLGIKSPHLFKKLCEQKKNPLTGVRMHENGHTKYRLSDINRYLSRLKSK